MKSDDPQKEPLRVGRALYMPEGVVQFLTYQSGETAIEVVDAEGDSYMATVALVPSGAEHPGETGVWLKGWSENSGVPQALESAGVVRLTGRTQSTGFVMAHHAELTERALKVREQQLRKRHH